jgi:type IV secretion system protein VirB9
VEIVEIPKPLPLPGQLKPLHGGAKAAAEPDDPRKRVDLANAAARVEPSRSGYINAVQVYPYSNGALYQVYAAPGQITDIALQEGEQLVGAGPVAAGDTVRWIIADTKMERVQLKRFTSSSSRRGPILPAISSSIRIAEPIIWNSLG